MHHLDQILATRPPVRARRSAAISSLLVRFSTILALLFGTAAFAAPNVVVTTIADTIANDGQTSLREALASVDSGGTITFSNTTANGEAVNFADGAAHTITLGGTELAISASVTITGPGAKFLTIDANHQSRAFHVTGGGTGAVIDGMTIINGLNSATGISSPDGGGIENEAGGIVRVSNCVFSGHFAKNGAAIHHLTGGHLEVFSCTFSGNSTHFYGAGIFNATGGSINIANSTFTNGTVNAGGGITNANGGSVTVANCTIAGNSGTFAGGIWNNNGTVSVANSLIAGNSASSSGPDVLGSFTSLGYNLIGTNAGSTGFTNGTNGDQVGVSLANSGLELDANNKPKLADNGGPTPTIKLLPGSFAIDAGDNFQIATDPSTGSRFFYDQRGSGFYRRAKGKPASVGGDIVDIGAFEVQFPVVTFAPGVNPFGVEVDIAGAPFDLTDASVGAMPAGGTFSGQGVSANSLHFDKLQTGAYVVFYQGPPDAYGNTPEVATFFVHIKAANPYMRVIATQARDGSGADVPGEPAGTKFTQFGLPSVASHKRIGARVKIKAAGGAEVPAIFVGFPDSGEVEVRAGDPAPAAVGQAGTFKTFGEPVFGGFYEYAFTATVTGAPKGGSTGLWAGSSPASLRLIAGNGILVPDANGTAIAGVAFDKVLGYANPNFDDTTTFLATIKGTGVTAANKTGIWQKESGTTRLLFRTGDACDLTAGTFGSGPDVVQKLALFTPAKTIPGQRRSYSQDYQFVQAVATFAKGRQALLSFDYDGATHRKIAFQNTDVSKLGQPSTNSDGEFAMRAGLIVGSTSATPPSPVTAKGDQVILVASSPAAFTLIAQEGSPVSATVADTYTALEEPAHNDDGATAFFAKVKAPALPASQTSVLIYNRHVAPNNALESLVLARTGTPAAGLNNGELWKSFTAMVLPDSEYGPVFLAKLTGPGVKGTNSIGLWAMDAEENVRLLVRTGDKIPINGEDKTVSLITTLGAAKDSPGQGRYVDPLGNVSAVLTFTDHSTALVHFGMPTQ